MDRTRYTKYHHKPTPQPRGKKQLSELSHSELKARILEERLSLQRLQDKIDRSPSKSERRTHLKTIGKRQNVLASLLSHRLNRLDEEGALDPHKRANLLAEIEELQKER